MEKVKKKKGYSPKRVVYLLGAGATQAEVSYGGGKPVNLLMRDSEELGSGVSSRIIKKARGIKELNDITKKFGDEIDIEKLISLLTNTGIEYYTKGAEELRKLYYDDIVEKLVNTEVLAEPALAVGLLEMHNSKPFNENAEKLTGIISLNHDNLFQVASQKVHGCINLGFEFCSDTFEKEKGKKTVPLLIQPHGSFNWINAVPIKVVRLQPHSEYNNILWIPPAILKESKDYPYNKLIGLAYEVLSKQCDILRIIGCSLSQNDWNIVSLLFNAQYNQSYPNKKSFNIELIMDQDTGDRIKQEYSYLQNIVPIGYLTDGDFSPYKTRKEITGDKESRESEEGAGYKRKSPYGTELGNPFKYWLGEKASYHIQRGEIDLSGAGTTLRKILEPK